MLQKNKRADQYAWSLRMARRFDTIMMVKGERRLLTCTQLSDPRWMPCLSFGCVVWFIQYLFQLQSLVCGTTCAAVLLRVVPPEWRADFARKECSLCCAPHLTVYGSVTSTRVEARLLSAATFCCAFEFKIDVFAALVPRCPKGGTCQT